MTPLKNSSNPLTYQESEISHLQNLLWSNTPENDLLVLEIVRSRGLSEILMPAFLAVVLTTEEESVKERFMEYISSTLEPAIAKTIEKIQFRYFTKINCNTLSRIVDIDQLIYNYFKRTGQGVSEFLFYGSSSSPLRAEMFQLYLSEIKEKININQYRRYLHIKGLTAFELKQLLEDEVIAATQWYSAFIQCPAVQTIPEALFHFTSIIHLSIVDVPLSTFPERIFQLTNLRVLKISGVTFGLPPKDWSGLKAINTIDLTNSQFQIDDLSFVATMPNLKKLYLGNSELTDPYLLLTQKTLAIEKWSGIGKTNRYPFKATLALASALKRSSLSKIDQYFFFDTIRAIENIKDLPALSTLNLLKALTINHLPLKQVCTKRLEEYAEETGSIDTLKKGAVVQIIGTTVMTKTDIKAKLKTFDIGYAAKYTKKVTHVLIGKNPKKLIDLEKNDLKIITENQLQKYCSSVQTPYLEQVPVEEQATIHENLISLLHSVDAANALIGLEMLKSVGVPATLMEDVLVVQKTNAEAKVRAAAKKILELYAPAEWLPLVQDKQHFAMIHKKIREQDINNKLRKVANNTSKELAAMLSIALFKIHARGLRYVLYHFKKPHSIRTTAFQAMMDGTHCNYSRGLGFTYLKDRTPDNISLYKMQTADIFPFDLTTMFDVIESIDFHNCKFQKINQRIGSFVDLKHLDCSCNLINKLPKILHKLKKLETLDLSNNTFKDFPMEVLNLPNLKRLDLRHMHDFQTSGYHKLQIPVEIKTQLPNCKVLV